MKVSVVIPTRDRARLILETLDSVWQQTYRPIEVIVVDDGSTDDTRQVVERWQEAHCDGQFRMTCVHQERRSAPAARNCGHSLACGDFLQFFDSDDIMFPEKLAKQVDVLAHGDVDFVACDYAFFREAPSEWTQVVRLSKMKHNPVKHVSHCVLNTHSPLFRRESLAKVGAWCEVPSRWDDLEFTFRALARGLRGVWLDEVLYGVRDHGEGLTVAPDDALDNGCLNSCMEIERVAGECGIADRSLRNALGRRMVDLSYMLARRGKIEKSNEVFAEASCRLSPMFRIAHRLLRAMRRVDKRAVAE